MAARLSGRTLAFNKRWQGFYRAVTPTLEEIDEYARTHNGNRVPGVYRAECVRCGKRIWFSGLGKGAHERTAHSGWK